ncbi:MAG: PaaI family thioesterase [Candidatus Hydrogenedentes bacterium]|nr:PaaI family thioesterase [Candidatus Hydrogenedentota bacterium]
MEISIESANAMVNAYFPGLIGVEFTETAPGRSVCRATVNTKMHNPGGILHGGVPYTLADTGMAIALMQMLDEGQRLSTLEIKMTYFKPVVEGDIICTTTVVNKGKRIAFLESEVTDGARIVAKATGTYYIA